MMNIEQINLELDNSRLNINLKLYKVLKDVIKTKFTDNQIIKLIEKLKILVESEENFETKITSLYEHISDLTANPNKKAQIINLFDNSIFEDKDLIILKIVLSMIRFKDFILAKSKLISENFRVTSNIHIMDFAYDYNMLLLPYSTRISGALLIKILQEQIALNQDNVYHFILEDLNKIDDLDFDISLQVIYAESASQSIRSSSGNGYEKRFEEVLKNNSIRYEGQSHDANLEAMEYDFKLKIDDKLVGISAKRTLRERYKQNHENVEELEVDTVFLVTLGIDLNEAKVNSILEKDQYFIFVASDIYEQKTFFQRNPKVYPLNQLTNSKIREIIQY